MISQDQERYCMLSNSLTIIRKHGVKGLKKLIFKKRWDILYFAIFGTFSKK